MKNILVIIFFLVSFFKVQAQSVSRDTHIASTCCEEGRGCTGSAYCSACKNCTGCKHCAKNGGSCGVCNRGRSTSGRLPKITRSSTSSTFSKGMRLWVVSPVLNLREAPTSSSRILRKLKENQEIELLEVSGPWLKIKVKIDDVTGYVYSSYLKSKDR